MAQQAIDCLVPGYLEGAITDADTVTSFPTMSSSSPCCAHLFIPHSLAVYLSFLSNLMLSELLSVSFALTAGKREEAKAALVTIP